MNIKNEIKNIEYNEAVEILIIEFNDNTKMYFSEITKKQCEQMLNYTGKGY